MSKVVKCDYIDECCHGNNGAKCAVCKNNKMRNYISSFFIDASKEIIPEKRPIIEHYIGTAEQTKGYECPVCHGFTNPYEMQDGLCSRCGYRLFDIS